MCNGFSIVLSLSTLFGVIILVFNIVAVLEIVVPVLLILLPARVINENVLRQLLFPRPQD
jgi:uncharacterized membrane protein